MSTKPSDIRLVVKERWGTTEWGGPVWTERDPTESELVDALIAEGGLVEVTVNSMSHDRPLYQLRMPKETR